MAGQVDLNVPNARAYDAMHTEMLIPFVTVTSDGTRGNLIAGVLGATRADGVTRTYYQTLILQRTANHSDQGDLGYIPPAITQPLNFATSGSETYPAIWLQQTENRRVASLPANVLAPYTATYNALRGMLPGTILASDQRLRNSFPFQSFNAIVVQDPLHEQTQLQLFSRSFRNVAFAGVDRRQEGIFQTMPNAFILPVTASIQEKWIRLTFQPDDRRRMRQYIRLILSRYATYQVPDPNTPGVQNAPTAWWVGNNAVGNRGNSFFVYDTSSCIFHYFETLRRVSGWWENSFYSKGNTVFVNRDLSVIRKRIVRVQVGDEELHFRDYMTVIYDRLRRISSIFAPNDVDVPYYVKCNFYIPSTDAVARDIPTEATMNFLADQLFGGQNPREYVMTLVTQSLLDMLYNYPAAQFTHYTLYAEFIFVKDQRLIDQIQQETQAAAMRALRALTDLVDADELEQMIAQTEDSPRQRVRFNESTSTTANSTTARTSSLTQSGLRIRGGAHAGNSHHERMFVKGSMMRRFLGERSLFLSPYRPHETCIIMSLFRAERTIYHFQGLQLQKIDKAPRGAHTGEYEYMFQPGHTTEFEQTQRPIPFIYRDPTQGVFLRMGVCEKYAGTTEGKYLPGAFDEEEIRVWELAAEEMVARMEWTLQRDVNINSLDDVCQAYADTFRICVSIYDLECRGTRIQVYTPDQRVVRQLLQPGEERVIQMIHLAIDSGHCHAISNIQAFLTSDHRTQRSIGVYQHCPFCDCRTSREMNSQATAKKHISACAAHEDGFTSKMEAAFMENVMTTPCETRLCFRKQGPSYYECLTCKQEVTQANYLTHTCTLVKKAEQKLIPNDRIYVYDLEAAQVLDSMTGLKVHHCNCVIIQAVYGDGSWRHYESEIEFVQALAAEDSAYKDCTFLAHNGSGYDCQFLLRILERWEIEHEFIPSPGTQHKFLQIRLKKNNIRLLDFMRFVPGSLKSIAESFQCPLSKGDFPHHFNDGSHMDYRGPLPPNNPLEEDYWCQKHCRSEKNAEEFQKWYTEEAQEEFCGCWGAETCTCGKKAWVFRDELIKYCVLDVQVLSKVVKAYREEILGLYRDAEEDSSDVVPWKAIQLDPFSCMTIAQICIRMLAHGFTKENQTITTLHQRQRGGLNPLALSWMDEKARTFGVSITHRGNWIREYYHIKLQLHLDGYDAVNNTVYWFVDCKYWGCPHCCDIPWEHSVHPTRHTRYSDLAAQYQLIRDTLHREYRQAEVIWEHEYRNSQEFTAITPQEKIANELFRFDEAFYGGRTEVFQAYASPQPTERIEYHDVTSLYPSVYLAELPIGLPIHLRLHEIDRERLHPTASNRYFGFVKVFVIPKRSDCIGLLPLRDSKSGRLCFPVYPMRGVWGTQELYLAMQNGYEVTEIYELYHWEPEQRSTCYLRGYLNTYMRMKQESEGWKKLGADCDEPSEEVKDQLVEELYIQNGHIGRIRKEKVCKNPVKRQLAKLFLNSLWGKFAQKESTFESMTIYGPAQFAYVWSHCAVEKETFTFRETCPGTYKVRFQFKSAYVKHIPHGNLLLAARVTEAARCVLHERMLRIGPSRIIYCDTDSIVFHRSSDMVDLEGIGLGKWVNEYPGKIIAEFAAIAPKMYTITFENTAKECVKAKGVMLSIRNRGALKMSAIKQLLLDAVHHGLGEDSIQGNIMLENMSIFTNCQHMAYGYAAMLTRENTKSVRVVISKRQLLVDKEFQFTPGSTIQTRPWGFIA